MRSTITLVLAFGFWFHALTQWTSETVGTLSNRSLVDDGTALYDASYTHGVDKRLHGSSTWNFVNTGLPSVGGNVFVESVGWNGSYLFAGTDAGIYRSNDGGGMWTIANGTLAASDIVHASKFFLFNGVTMAMFSGTIANGGGIYRTTDNGTTWNIGHSGMGSNVEVHYLTLIGPMLQASTSTGIWSSFDNGLSWTAEAIVNYATYSLADHGSTWVIVTTFGIRYSTDAGASWIDATGDVNNPTSGEMIAFDGDLYCILPPPTGCVRSLDGGATWSAYNGGFSVVDAQAQDEFYAVGNSLYCAALFDVYSITGTGLGVREGPRPNGSARITPTVFSDGYLLTTGDAQGELQAIDATGRVARRVHVSARQDTWIDRGGLAPGVYQMMIVDPNTSQVTALGKVVAY